MRDIGLQDGKHVRKRFYPKHSGYAGSRILLAFVADIGAYMHDPTNGSAKTMG